MDASIKIIFFSEGHLNRDTSSIESVLSLALRASVILRYFIAAFPQRRDPCARLLSGRFLVRGFFSRSFGGGLLLCYGSSFTLLS